MIGKNRRIMASILSLAVMASALPMSGVFAVEDTAVPAVTADAASNDDIFIKNLTLTQLLYIEETQTVSKWNETFADHIAKLEADGFDEDLNKDNYKELIDYVIAKSGSYSEFVSNAIKNTNANAKLNNGVFTITGNVTDMSQAFDDEVNKKLNDILASIDSNDKMQLENITNTDFNVTVTIDTSKLAETKSAEISYSAECDDVTYTGMKIFDLVDSKINDIEAACKKYCNDKYAEDYAKLQGTDINAPEYAEVKAEFDKTLEVIDKLNSVVESYRDKAAKAKEKVQNALTTTEISVSAATADEAYSKLYNDKRLPARVKAKLPATLDAALATEAFSKGLSAVSNVITVSDVAELLDGAQDITFSLSNGNVEMTAKVFDAELNKPANKLIEFSVATDASATAYLNITRLSLEPETTTTPDVTDVSDSSDVSDSDVSNTDVSDTDVSSSDTDVSSSDTDTSGSVTTDVSSSDTDTSGSVTTDVSGSDTDTSGSVTTVSGVETTVSGSVTTVSGSESVDPGSVTTVSGSESVDPGSVTTVSGSESVDPGSVTTVSGSESVDPGSVTTVSGVETTVSGVETTVSGSVTTVSGVETTVSGSVTTVSGVETTVSGSVTTVSGSETTVSDSEVSVSETTPSDNKSLWEKAKDDKTGKFKAAILGDVSLDFDIKAAEELTPTQAISSYDALQILQNTVQTLDLTNLQSVVGDVDFDGKITSYDALLILQHTVQLRESFEDETKTNKAIYVAVEFDTDLETILNREYYTTSKTISPVKYTKFGFDK